MIRLRRVLGQDMVNAGFDADGNPIFAPSDAGNEILDSNGNAIPYGPANQADNMVLDKNGNPISYGPANPTAQQYADSQKPKGTSANWSSFFSPSKPPTQTVIVQGQAPGLPAPSNNSIIIAVATVGVAAVMLAFVFKK